MALISLVVILAAVNLYGIAVTAAPQYAYPYPCSPPQCHYQAVPVQMQLPIMNQGLDTSCCGSTQTAPAAPLAVSIPPATSTTTGDSCCQTASPLPACCIHVKPGNNKMVKVNTGGQTYKLTVKLEKAGKAAPSPAGSSPCNSAPISPCGGAQPSPCGVPSMPCGGAQPAAAPQALNVTAGNGTSVNVTSGNNTSAAPGNNTSAAPGNNTSAAPGNNTSGTPGNNTSGTPGNNTSGTPGNNTSGGQKPGSIEDCRQKGLAEHTAKRKIHDAPPLTLNADLNKQAQAYADKLVSGKPELPAGLVHSGTTDGENLDYSCSQPDAGYDCAQATGKWYDEAKDYDFKKPGFSTTTGHFTQVVWKGTKELGFGRASFKKDDGQTCYIVVGRYKPLGNIPKQYPANVLQGSYKP